MSTASYQVNPDITVSCDDEQIIVRAATNTYRLSDASLWPFITEALSTAEDLSIPEAADGQQSEDVARLAAAFELLARSEVLVANEGATWPDSVVALHNRSGGNVDHATIAERLETARVTVVGDSTSTAARALLEGLRAYPLSEPDLVGSPADLDTSEVDIVVVCASDPHDRVLDEMNTRALELGLRVWVPLVPAVGGTFTVGPWYYPHQSACHTCRRLREGSVEREPALAQDRRNGTSAVPRMDRTASQPALTAMMTAMLTDGVVQHLALDGAHGQAVVGAYAEVTRALEGFETTNHRILRVPRCPSCSPAEGTGFPQIWYHEE